MIFLTIFGACAFTMKVFFGLPIPWIVVTVPIYFILLVVTCRLLKEFVHVPADPRGPRTQHQRLATDPGLPSTQGSSQEAGRNREPSDPKRGDEAPGLPPTEAPKNQKNREKVIR